MCFSFIFVVIDSHKLWRISQMQHTCMHTYHTYRTASMLNRLLRRPCGFQSGHFCDATVLQEAPTCPQSCVFIYERSALGAVFDRSWCSEMCLVRATQGQDKPCLSKLSRGEEMERGSACLRCQSILSVYSCHTHATEVTITT